MKPHAEFNRPSTDGADRVALAGAAAGDTGAFDGLVVAHAATLHRFAHSLGVRDSDLDDVLQDALVSAWRAAGSYRGEGTVRSWLVTIVHNAVRQWQRQSMVAATRRADLDEAHALESLESVADRAGWGRTDGGQAADAHEVVSLALQRLSPEDREILVLRELEELTGEEVAQVLALSLPAVKSRLHRARLRLAAAVRTLERDTPSLSSGVPHAGP